MLPTRVLVDRGTNMTILGSIVGVLAPVSNFRRSIGLAACALIVTAAGMGSAEADPIRAGLFAPLTGPAARTGQEIKNGAQMAVEDARAAGELPAKIDGQTRDLALIPVDSESSPEKAIRAFQDAVSREHVDVMLNGWHGSISLALIDIEASYNIIHFGDLGAPEDIANKINQKGYTHWFKGWPAPRTMSGLYVDAIEDFIQAGKWSPSTKKAAIVAEDTDWGRTWTDAIAKRLKETGWDVVGRDFVRMDESEFGPLLTKYKAAGVTLTASTLGPVAAVAFVKQHYNAGLTGLLIADGLGWSADWYAKTGGAADYVISMDSPRTITPQEKEWSKRYQDKYGAVPPPASAGQAYDYTRMFIKGLNAAGTLEKAKLSDTLLNLEYTGIWHHYAFAKKAGDHAISPYEVKVGPFMKGFSFPMVQYLGDKAEIIWPKEYAQREFLAPGQ